MNTPDPYQGEQLRTRNAYIITGVLMVSALLSAFPLIYFGVSKNLPQLFIVPGVLFVCLLLNIIPIILIGRGRRDMAMMINIVLALISTSSFIFVIQGRGLLTALLLLLAMSAISGFAMSPKYTTSVAITSILFSAGVIALDMVLRINRIILPEMDTFSPPLAGVLGIPLLLIFIQQYRRFSLQTKISLGILATGGVAVSIASYFALSQISDITDLFGGRLETNVRRSAEEQLINKVENEAAIANDFFNEIASHVEDISSYHASLLNRSEALGLGTYWNSSEKLVQLPGGQYGNSAGDFSSVFIPSGVSIDESILIGLNTSAYLDFTIPNHLEQDKSILAIYAINTRGVVRYYPNIELASLLPPDFDATERSYYKITAPLFNQEKLTRWAIPYIDATGGGLVVTVASPVYLGDQFEGIIAADIQLKEITEQISAISVGQSGYAFLVDDAGRLIYMPPAGYRLFGIDPSQIAPEDFFKHTILGKGSGELQNFTNRMVAGGKGMGTIPVDGADTYISFSPLPSTGYSLALVVPAAEMQSAIATTRQDSANQLRASIQAALITLTATFIGALLVSIALGQLISSPVKSLTQTANQIASGDLTARTNVVTEDETGALARSFNTMADRLKETLQGLEERIAIRTQELEAVSQTNAYRASLFESIARISRIISATRQLDQLLPQITETISSQLGYYHVGIFLVDSLKEYAVLAAANSDGGKLMLTRNHRLRIGETGIVGFVTQTGNPRVALDVGRDAVYFNNPDLPETHSEIALPLRSRNEIIGALDVQSKETNAFREEDINILSVLADQVSTAIQNAKLFEESQDARVQAEQAAAQLGEQQWRQYLKRESISNFQFDGVMVHELSPNTKTPANHLAIPIILRGVQIGTLKLSTTDPDRKWDLHEVAMAQATADRTALAIETARLLEDAQKRAAKERTIGQISAKLGNLVNLDNIVQTTIQELGGTLPGTEVVIQFTSGQSG